MPADLCITRLTVTHYTTEFADLQLEETLGFDIVYKRGGKLSTSKRSVHISTTFAQMA